MTAPRTTPTATTSTSARTRITGAAPLEPLEPVPVLAAPVPVAVGVESTRVPFTYAIPPSPVHGFAAPLAVKFTTAGRAAAVSAVSVPAATKTPLPLTPFALVFGAAKGW